jgi:hypothetical protein
MIISASRRTDLPAFYAKWFINRIRAGYCTVVNPYNRQQLTLVSLNPEDVDVIVFWTKNPQPLLPYLNELDSLGYRYYFQYTLTGYLSAIEPGVPNVEKNLDTFKKLAGMVGPERVIWRYDPIIISNLTDFKYHIKQFANLCVRLEQSTRRLVISFVDEYRKAKHKFNRLERQNIKVKQGLTEGDVQKLVGFIVDQAAARGMEVFSCAEALDLSPCGVKPGKCIDDNYINSVFGIKVSALKDKSQRPACGCVRSKDIGAYDTCLHGCLYCYAGTLAAAQKNYARHYPDSPSLTGRYEAKDTTSPLQPGLFDFKEPPG